MPVVRQTGCSLNLAVFLGSGVCSWLLLETQGTENSSSVNPTLEEEELRVKTSEQDAPLAHLVEAPWLAFFARLFDAARNTDWGEGK